MVFCRLPGILGGAGEEPITGSAHLGQHYAGLQGHRPDISHHVHPGSGSYDRGGSWNCNVLHHFVRSATRSFVAFEHKN